MAAKDDFDILSQFIQWAGIEGEEAEGFLSEMMSRRGHKAVPSWVDAPKDGGKGGNSGNATILGLNRGGNRNSGGGSNFQYGS